LLLTFIYLFIDKTSGANLKMVFSIYKSPKNFEFFLGDWSGLVPSTLHPTNANNFG